MYRTSMYYDIELFRPFRARQKFTFLTITRLVVGISEIFLDIRKLDEKTKKDMAADFFYLVGKGVKIALQSKKTIFDIKRYLTFQK